MAKGDPITSPYVYDSGSDSGGRHLTATFNFDNATRALTGAVAHRDVGCLYVAIIIGTPGGNQLRLPSSGSLPTGDFAFTAAQLASAVSPVTPTGLHTIEDVLALQITATE